MGCNHMVDFEQVRHEVQRGHILRYLKNAGLRPVTPTMLLYYLRDRGYPATHDGLDFQLRYLQDKALVTLEIPEPPIGEKEEIKAVRILAAGVDELDGRKAGESGVKF
jgi:hypothetical protein